MVFLTLSLQDVVEPTFGAGIITSNFPSVEMAEVYHQSVPPATTPGTIVIDLSC